VGDLETRAGAKSFHGELLSSFLVQYSSFSNWNISDIAVGKVVAVVVVVVDGDVRQGCNSVQAFDYWEQDFEDPKVRVVCLATCVLQGIIETRDF